MFQAARMAARKHLSAIATLGVAAALVVGGVAVAQSGSGSESRGSQGPSGQGVGHRPPGPPPMMGPGGKNLTYAELHVLNKEGDSEVVRIDNGKVKSTSNSSITLTENDGNEVTIKVDDNTDVLGKPGAETTLADLEAGQQVSVTATEGEAAKAIMVMPKKGELPSGFHGGPPPGAPPMEGSAPGAPPKEGSSE
ncbi:MAG TPA: hypothetical protein VG448_11965 [Solirubrobacterales bacterium]|nr:hypothetical protein [Solirubrobacterales bacterium]